MREALTPQRRSSRLLHRPELPAGLLATAIFVLASAFVAMRATNTAVRSMEASLISKTSEAL